MDKFFENKRRIYNLLIKKIIIYGYMKIYDKYFSYFDGITDDINEAVYSSEIKSIAEFYSEFFIDYYLRDEDVVEKICYHLVIEYINNLCLKFLRGMLRKRSFR